MRVYLTTYPQFDYVEFERFLYSSGKKDTAENLLTAMPVVPIEDDVPQHYNLKFDVAIIEAAARICYDSYGKGRKNPADFIDNILRSKHFSVLEHANYGFTIAGVSRSLTHELIRHRHLSYSELSQRFVDMSDADFVSPPLLFGDDAALKKVESAFDYCKKVYGELIEHIDARYPSSSRKQMREAARAVLPNCTPTNIFVTGNIRAWRDVIMLRSSEAADAEIRDLSVKIFDQLQRRVPMLLADMVKDENGSIVYRGDLNE